MNVLAFLGFIALVVITGIRLGLRAARTSVRTIRSHNDRIDADIDFLWSIPADMDWGSNEY